MSYTLRQYLNLLKVISDLKDTKVRKNLLRAVKNDKQFFRATKEIMQNVLHGNIPLDKPQLKKLQKYKRVIRKLSCSHINCKKRSSLIVQSGGALSILVPLVVSLLQTLIK